MILSTKFFPKLLLVLLTAFGCCSLFPGCRAHIDDALVTESILPAETVAIGNAAWDLHTQELTMVDADRNTLLDHLTRFPKLETLVLEGTVPDLDTLLSLKDQFPHVDFVLPITIGNRIISTDTAILDLSDARLEPDMLQKCLPLFFRLQELNLMGTNLDDKQIMALADKLPDVFISCELTMAEHRFPTDSSEIDISGFPVTVQEVEKILPYFPRLKKLNMSFCGIADEEMDALNQRYPDISIIWTLTIGEVKTRTDAVYFYPAEANYYPTNEQMKKLRYCTELVAIDIGHTRATDCEFLWYTPKVRYLILADTGITDITPVGNLKELIYLELFNLRITDYSPLLNCTKLQDLNIGTTHADPGPLSKMTWLHNLQWHRADQDPKTREEVLKLPEQLPDTNVDLYPKKKARNIGGGWRYLPNYYVFRDIIGATYFNQDQIGDYWGQEDGNRIMACESGKSFAAYTLAEIVRERIDKGEPIIGLKNTDSEKAEILHRTLIEAESWITEG